MTIEYLNPFDVKLDPENMYILCAGVPVEVRLAEEILSVKQLGEECYKDFVDKRIRKITLKIHDPITRNKTKLFKSAGKNVVLHHKNKEQVVEVNRDILAKLLAQSAKHREQLTSWKPSLIRGALSHSTLRIQMEQEEQQQKVNSLMKSSRTAMSLLIQVASRYQRTDLRHI